MRSGFPTQVLGNKALGLHLSGTEASQAGDVELVRMLLEAGADKEPSRAKRSQADGWQPFAVTMVVSTQQCDQLINRMGVYRSLSK